MNLFVVDDEIHALNYLSSVLKETYPHSEVLSFSKTKDALLKAKDVKCDVAFLDIRMDEKNGIQLARELKDINGDTNIIFTTAYSEYALEAYRVYASDYLMKPISSDAITKAMANLRNPVLPDAENKLRIQCFGNFEVFSGDKPVAFKRAKTKELFAYLVDKEGTPCSRSELITILWNESDSRFLRSNLRNLIADLNKALASVNAESVLIKEKNALAIAPELVVCDYYDFTRQIPYAVNSYHGQYMAQYSWAEFTLANIENNR